VSSVLINQRISEIQNLLPVFKEESESAILHASSLISSAFKSGAKLLICGNGGSAADSQHFAAEFVSAFSRKIKRKGLPAIALTVDSSVITAFSNDFDFDGVYARQIEALGKKGDVVAIFSTSGNSKNCIEAANMAKAMGILTVAFTGQGGALQNVADIVVRVPSTNTQHIQECHMIAYHLIAELVEVSIEEVLS
jgi:D-sedoheptulose 7-phosphate isomerase